MDYRKPELGTLRSAIDSIHGIQKMDVSADSTELNHPPTATSAAYEADE